MVSPEGSTEGTKDVKVFTPPVCWVWKWLVVTLGFNIYNTVGVALFV